MNAANACINVKQQVVFKRDLADFTNRIDDTVRIAWSRCDKQNRIRRNCLLNGMRIGAEISWIEWRDNWLQPKIVGDFVKRRMRRLRKHNFGRSDFGALGASLVARPCMPA